MVPLGLGVGARQAKTRFPSVLKGVCELRSSAAGRRSQWLLKQQPPQTPESRVVLSIFILQRKERHREVKALPEVTQQGHGAAGPHPGPSARGPCLGPAPEVGGAAWTRVSGGPQLTPDLSSSIVPR